MTNLSDRYESTVSQLVEANEQLVLAMLQAQTDAETVARRLEEISRSAQLDVLTELPNRILLLDRFTRAIASAKRSGGCLTLLFLDINNFKHINDTLGHAVGDQVLKQVAEVLVSSVRDADTVSRYGGDEFLILLPDISQISDAVLIADKVTKMLAVPLHAGDHELRLTASIGISLYPDDGLDADTLIDRADAAMYRAKRSRLGELVFPGEALTNLEKKALKAQQPATLSELALAEQERWHLQQKEANEQLVLAALSAQALQAAAEEAQRRQTEFLAVLAHELRCPLTPIRNASAVLSMIRTDEPLLMRVQTVIERQVVHMSRLVGDLLDVSRASTGKLRLECKTVDMIEIIDTVVDACRPAMDARLQHLDVLAPTHVLELQGDPVRLSQIVSNLLDNASKYTPEGGTISFSVTENAQDIVLSISDNGIGIPPDALAGIFQPFVQDAHAIGFNGAGLGLGLTVVRELVEAHRGTVVASSAGTGLGSQFVVTLPRSHEGVGAD